MLWFLCAVQKGNQTFILHLSFIAVIDISTSVTVDLKTPTFLWYRINFELKFPNTEFISHKCLDLAYYTVKIGCMSGDSVVSFGYSL